MIEDLIAIRKKTHTKYRKMDLDTNLEGEYENNYNFLGNLKF